MVFAPALLAVSLVGLVRAGRREVGHLRARHGGVELQASSVPRNRGDSMTVVVSPDSPYEPYDRYQGMGTGARNLILLFGLAVVVLLLALARL
jgi:hypothetical protein